MSEVLFPFDRQDTMRPMSCFDEEFHGSSSLSLSLSMYNFVFYYYYSFFLSFLSLYWVLSSSFRFFMNGRSWVLSRCKDIFFRKYYHMHYHFLRKCNHDIRVQGIQFVGLTVMPLEPWKLYYGLNEIITVAKETSVSFLHIKLETKGISVDTKNCRQLNDPSHAVKGGFDT